MQILIALENFKISAYKFKLIVFLLLTFSFQNCFTFALYSKDNEYRTHKKSNRNTFQSSPYKIKSIFQNKTNFQINWFSNVYLIGDYQNKEVRENQNCIAKDLVEQYFQLELNEKNTLYKCNSDLENLENVSFEEVEELENKIWLKELNIAIDLKKNFSIYYNPFSPADQFCQNSSFIKCKNQIRGFLKNQKIESIYSINGIDEIWLIFDSKKILQMYRSSHGYKVVAVNGKPKWVTMDDFYKIPDSKKEKLIFREMPELENGYFIGLLTIENELIEPKHLSKVFKLNFKNTRIKPGLIFVFNNRALDEKIDKSVWSFYPVFYPISIGLDFLTSPIQILSIIFWGIENHLWLGNCLLKVSCKTPLG